MTAPLHGSCKTPGGKLVAVDLRVEKDRLTDVQVHGDFFLHPEDALQHITAALEGAPATEDEAALAARVHQAMPSGVEWLGASPEALATAVVRALKSAGEQAAGGGDRGWA